MKPFELSLKFTGSFRVLNKFEYSVTCANSYFIIADSAPRIHFAKVF